MTFTRFYEYHWKFSAIKRDLKFETKRIKSIRTQNRNLFLDIDIDMLAVTGFLAKLVYLVDFGWRSALAQAKSFSDRILFYRHNL